MVRQLEQFTPDDPQEGDPDNEDRVEAASLGLMRYRQAKGSEIPDPDDITDLLTDLRHYCEANDLDFTAAVESSRNNFHHEADQSIFQPPKFEGKRYVPFFNIDRDWWTIWDHTEGGMMDDERDGDGDRIYTFSRKVEAQGWADDLNLGEEEP